MNKAKMTKKFFFDLMEERINEIEEETEKMKEMNEKEGYTHEVSYKHTTLHARALEISMLIFDAREIDWFKYSELDERLHTILDRLNLSKWDN